MLKGAIFNLGSRQGWFKRKIKLNANQLTVHNQGWGTEVWSEIFFESFSHVNRPDGVFFSILYSILKGNRVALGREEGFRGVTLTKKDAYRPPLGVRGKPRAAAKGGGQKGFLKLWRK